MSYTAIVSKITVRPHPGADRLLLGLCLGNQVIVGLDTKDRDLGVYFPTDGQLSHEMCLCNDLYTASAQAELGIKAKSAGFFDIKKRVRTQRFRGEKSDGFWVPLSFLDWTGAGHTLKEGDQFSELGGYQVCQKYYNPKTLRALRGRTQATKPKSIYFPEHIDTTQFRFVAESIPDDGVYYITEKMHGTSGRFAYVPEEQPLPRWKEWLNTNLFKHGFFKSIRKWTYLNGSRRVTIGSTTGEGYYGSNEFRLNAVRDLTLRKGEILFFELVGWVNDSTTIMPAHDATKLQDKAVLSKFGKNVTYTYGCPPGVCRLYLYKIAHVNEDGIVTELSWTQVALRAKELGVATVPLLSGPLTASQLKTKWSTDNFNEALRWEVENWSSGSSAIHGLQLKEGVVLRVESSLAGITHVKNKSYEFKVMEGILKEADTSIDLEEIS